jgi:hypothetical protein
MLNFVGQCSTGAGAGTGAGTGTTGTDTASGTGTSASGLVPALHRLLLRRTHHQSHCH